jgi:hypothetical protein
MMLRKIPLLLVPLALLCPTISHGGLFGPSNYDECITDSMRGVSSDVAARAIIESCRNLFPDSQREAAPQAAPAPAPAPAPASVPAPTENSTTPAAAAAVAPVAQAAAPIATEPLDTTAARSLTADEFDRLRTKAKVFGSTYRVTVDNGNPDLTLTEVTIAVWDDSDPSASRKEYSEAAWIGPQSSAEVKYTVHYRGDESSWNWDVVAARGVE